MNYLKSRKHSGLQWKKQKNKRILRKEYLETFSSSMRDTIEHVKVIDPEGNDVTPDKVKATKAKKFLN